MKYIISPQHHPALQPPQLYPENKSWKLGVMVTLVNLTGLRSTIETHLWVCLWGILYSTFIKERSPALFVDGITPWEGSWLNEKERASCAQVFLARFPDWGHCDEPPPAPDATRSSHDGPYPQKLSENQTFLPKVAFVRCFVARTRKVTYSPRFGIGPMLASFYFLPENFLLEL